ncbi:MAG: hypothetical protein ACTSWN_13020 [Promethearchaeota archaeon]
MGGQDDRPRDRLAGAEENIFQKMVDQIGEFIRPMVEQLFGKQAEEKGKKNDLLEKAKELSGNVVKSIVDFNDNILKTLKLDENELIANFQDQAKQFLKQAGLLEEEFESEDYY